MGKWVYIQCYATEPREIVHVSKGLAPNSSFPSPAFAEAIVEADDYGGAITAGQKLREAGDKRLQEGKDSLMNDHAVEIPMRQCPQCGRLGDLPLGYSDFINDCPYCRKGPVGPDRQVQVVDGVLRPVPWNGRDAKRPMEGDSDYDLMERALSVIKESDGADEHRELIEELEATLRDRPTEAHSLEESLQDLADIQEELSRLMSRLRSVEDELAAIKVRIAPVVP